MLPGGQYALSIGARQAIEAAPGARSAPEVAGSAEVRNGHNAYVGGACAEAGATATPRGAATEGNRAGIEGASGAAIQKARRVASMQAGGEDHRG